MSGSGKKREGNLNNGSVFVSIDVQMGLWPDAGSVDTEIVLSRELEGGAATPEVLSREFKVWPAPFEVILPEVWVSSPFGGRTDGEEAA